MAKRDTSAAMADEASISLVPRLTIEAAERTAEDLKAALNNSTQTLRLDVSAVEAITTPGIQLLIATMKALHAQNRQAEFIHTPEHVLNTLQLMGMPDLLTSPPSNGA